MLVNTPRRTGSSHSGLGEWLIQRVTSIYLAGFVLYLVWHFWGAPRPDYAAWRAWFAHGPVRLAWALFIACLLAHAWVGMRSIYMDYLRPPWLRFGALLVTGFGLAALALWAAQIFIGAAG
jgi:succinate dehydrogenase / fumarate reductase membrane anchor subunit